MVGKLSVNSELSLRILREVLLGFFVFVYYQQRDDVFLVYFVFLFVKTNS